MRLILVALVLSSCASTDYTYVGKSDYSTTCFKEDDKIKCINIDNYTDEEMMHSMSPYEYKHMMRIWE